MGAPTLRMGDRGDDVSALKEILGALNYRISGQTSDFDIGTRSAVEAFQDDNGLQIDGVVGVQTWDAMYDVFSDYCAASPKMQLPMLRIGDSGEYVTSLQTDLKQFGFYHGPIDGKFGSGTDTAVKNFQAASGLSVDGIVGKETWQMLYEEGSGPSPMELQDCDCWQI